MAHTNATPNYSLPQFLGTDKPAWLTDVNAAMLAIDTQMKANADAADASTIIDEIFPIGSEYVTNTNVMPAIGGTWVLVNKGFITGDFSLDALDITIVDCDNFTIECRRTEHSLALRLWASNVQNIGGNTTVTLAIIRPQALGVSQVGSGDTPTYGTALSNSGDVLFTYQITSAGEVQVLDAFKFTTAPAISHNYTGNISAFEVVIPITDPSTMLDAACDRFVWKRVS